MYRHVKGGCTGWSREAVNNFEATFAVSRAAALWPQITNWDIFRISTEPTSFRILNYFHSRWWQTPRFCNNVRICGFLSLESFEAGNLHAFWHQRLLSNISRPDWKESILKIPRSISHQLVSTLGLASGLPTIHIDSGPTMELCSGRRLNIGTKVWRMRPRQRCRLFWQRLQR